MDPEDLYGLAQNAGVLSPATPGYADAFLSPAGSTPTPAGPTPYTDEDIYAHFVPQQGVMDEGLTPPTNPLSPSPSEPLPPVPQQTKEKGKVSASISGFSGKKNAAVRKGPGSALDQRIAAVTAEEEAQGAQRAQPFTEAATAEKDALHQEALATADQITATGHQNQILATLKQNYDTQTETMMTQERAKSAEAKANFVASLNDFRAARVDPTRIGSSSGAAAVAFVQDFLGARGIHTSAMATLNKAIDRDIDVQLEAIKRKGQVADGFKTLWDMQVQESHSFEEARTRMRAYMLDSTKTQIEANMAKFDAALATAKGQSAIAKIDGELAKNINLVNQHQDAATAQRIGQEIQRYGDELRASMEASRIAVERERLDLEKQKAAKAGKDAVVGDLVYDNSKSGGGYANGIFKPGVADAEKQKYREMQASTNHLTDLIGEYQSLNRQFGGQGPLAGTRLSKEQDARLRAIGGEILMQRQLKLSGKAVTESERKTLQYGTPERVWAMTRDIASQLADTERHERQDLNRKRETLVFDLPEGSDLRGFRSGMSGEGKTEIAETNIVSSGEDKKQSPEQKEYNSAVKLLEKHSAYQPVEDPTPDVKDDHARFMAAQPPPSEQEKVRSEVAPGLAEKAKSVKNFEGGLTRLKHVAERAKEEGDTTTYEQAVAMLRNRAAPVTVGVDQGEASDEALYSRMMLEDLGELTTAAGNEEGDISSSTSVHEALPPIPESKRKK